MSKAFQRRSGFGAAILLTAFAMVAARSVDADPLRVSDDDGRRAIITKIPPTVPPLARQAHITGRVVVDMIIAEQGSVEKVDVVSGNPILSAAVVSATKKWTFQPFKSNGAATKAIVRLTFEF